MIERNLIKSLFDEPIAQGADTLCIISGYATPNMASWFFKYVDEKIRLRKNTLNVNLVIGMTQEGISVRVHEGFKELVSNPFSGPIREFKCSYVFNSIPVNSKMYLWLKGDIPIFACVGSADFIQPSFSVNRKELMIECDPCEALDYYKRIEKESMYCTYAEIDNWIMIKNKEDIFDRYNNPSENETIPKVSLSLLDTKTGETHKTAGLNWGHRVTKYRRKDGTIKESHRNRNEAYIPLPSKISKSNFFPLGKQHFTVVTDDKIQLILRVEQQGNKAITTPQSNNLLGEYFRSRLNLPSGTFITRSHLERYGRTDVAFYKFDDEQFYMDFSPRGLI